MSVKPVKRHECLRRYAPESGHRHTSGSGQPKRKRCVCGGALVVRIGFYAVFAWRADGRYLAADVKAVYRTDREAAQRALLLGGNSHCVQWIEAEFYPATQI